MGHNENGFVSGISQPQKGQVMNRPNTPADKYPGFPKAIVDGRRQTSPGAAMRPSEIPEIRRVDPDTEWDEEYWDGFVEDYSETKRRQKRRESRRESCITR